MEFEMRRLSWIIWVGAIESLILKDESLSWLWAAGNVTIEEKLEKCFGNGRKDQEPRMRVAFRTRKGKKIEEYSPADTLIVAHRDSCQISDLQNCKTVNLYYLGHQISGNLLIRKLIYLSNQHLFLNVPSYSY